MLRELGEVDATLAMAHRWGELGTLFRVGTDTPSSPTVTTPVTRSLTCPVFTVPAGSRGIRPRRAGNPAGPEADACLTVLL